MSSFVFNSFKERYLKGNVPSVDNWTFIPVSEDFKDKLDKNEIRLDQYKNLQDFKDISDSLKTNENDTAVFDYKIEDGTLKVSGTGLIEGKSVEYKWRKVLSDEDLTNKPMFITKENYEDFKNYYYDIIKDNKNIQSYLYLGGFYFLRSKDELEWFANRANENNTIIGVIGDVIEGDIEVPICTDEAKPFEGVLDGNNYTININIIARNSDNGLVGILGKGGVVRNFKIKHTSTKNVINCEVPITLNYIKTNGRDVNCGILVGRNYGTIENIDASDPIDFTLSGFVPSVYSVTNKSDEVKWNETENIVRRKFDEKNENFFYLNSFCINSPGNICPYVGYFNEGKFSDDANGAYTDLNEKFTGLPYYGNKYNSLDSIDFSAQIEDNKIASIVYYPLGYFIQEANSAVNSNGLNKDTDILDSYIKSPIYYGLDNYGYFTVRLVKNGDTNKHDYVEMFNSNIIQKTLGSSYRNNLNLSPSYENTRNSLRLHPQARAAYNVGVIAGANFGTISSVSVNANIKNTSNFVGFIGGVVGKQANGKLEEVAVTSNFELYYGDDYLYEKHEDKEQTLSIDYSKGYQAFYKQTPILPNVCKTYLEDLQHLQLSSTVIDANGNFDEMLRNYCSAWYDKDDDYYSKYVNTANIVTEDVAVYNLRPIFVAGGLFGRYIPTINSTQTFTDNRISADCILKNVNVLYNDNYYTNTQKQIEKNYSERVRPENAFGIIAGKVDYATTTNNVYIKPSLNCENCNFSSQTTVGYPIRYFANYWDETNKEFVPITTTNEQQKQSLVSANSEVRLIGIYEIKNNVLDSISYNVNGQPTYMNDSTLSSDTIQHPLTDAGIFWACDYPFELSSHYGGIIRTHNMFNYIDFSTQENLDKVSIKYEDEVIVGNVNDFNHYFYMEPNYNALTLTGGLNKRNVAASLITLNNCYTNADSLIEVYDDYLSNFNYMELPSEDLCTKSNINYEDVQNNSFTDDEIYLIRKYWNLYKTSISADIEVYSYEEDIEKIKNYVNWDNSELDFDSHSALFTNGLYLNYHINPLMMAGTQNTFDGYTTVQYPIIGVNYLKSDIMSLLPPSMTARDVTTVNYYDKFTHSFKPARKFIKNKIKFINTNFSSITTQNTITPFTIDKDTTIDDYFYYTYSAITTAAENEVSSKFVPLTDAFGYTQPIEYKYSNTSATMGYCINLSKEEQVTKTSNDISIGEYNTPKIIRKKINEAISEGTVFSTSCVSSINNLAGMLVIDSKYNNVMYLDLTNPVKLTGNPVRFNTDPIYEDKIKMILKVE